MIRAFEYFIFLLLFFFLLILAFYAYAVKLFPAPSYFTMFGYLARMKAGWILSLAAHIALACSAIYIAWKRRNWIVRFLFVICLYVLFQWIAVAVLSNQKLSHAHFMLTLPEDQLVIDKNRKGVYFSHRESAYVGKNTIISQATDNTSTASLQWYDTFDFSLPIAKKTFSFSNYRRETPTILKGFFSDLIFLSDLYSHWYDSVPLLYYAISIFSIALVFFSIFVLFFFLSPYPPGHVIAPFLLLRLLVYGIRVSVQEKIISVIFPENMVWYVFPVFVGAIGLAFMSIAASMRIREVGR